MNRYDFTPEMREISGFGGSYEMACRTMLKAGLEWWNKNPKADPRFKGSFLHKRHILGPITEENDDAKSLTKAMMDARMPDGRRCGDDATGTMLHIVIFHLFYIRRNGWEAYMKEMSKRRE